MDTLGPFPPAVLGPFQAIWDAWDTVDARCKIQPRSHFPRVIELQLKEYEEAWPNRVGSVNEVLDIISVALNWLRWLGLTPQDIADVVARRALRYKDPEEIFAKYKHIMAPEDIC